MSMRLTHVTVKLSSLTRNCKAYEADFLVDTGATDCLTPKDELRKIGIVPEGKAKTCCKFTRSTSRLLKETLTIYS